MPRSSLHAVIVGGGVFGCASAYRLAHAGMRVTLIEPDAFGAHASGKNPGNLNPLINTPPGLVSFALESFRLHQALADELAALGCGNYDLRPVRRILLAFDDTEQAALERTATLFDGHKDFATHLLGPEALREREPDVTPQACGGLLVEGNLSLDGRAFTAALADSARRLGARVVRARVTEIENATAHVQAVRTHCERIACDLVVLATGPWVAESKRWFGLTLPVEPIRGQLLRVSTDAGPRHDLTHGHISLYRRGVGEIWLGVTKEHAGLDEAPTEAGRAYLLSEAARLFPRIAAAKVLEHVASLRPATPSGLPIVGTAPGWNNVYAINGGGIKGMLLSAGLSQALCEIIRDGCTALPVDTLTTPGEEFAHPVY